MYADTSEPDRRLFMSYGHDPVYLERAGGDFGKALDLLHKDFPAKTLRGLQLKCMIGSLFPLAPVPSNFQEILEAFGFRFPGEYAASFFEFIDSLEVGLTKVKS